MPPDEAPPTSREAYLKAVTIGPRVPLDAPIHLASYDPGWPAAFDRLAGRIREALGERVRLLEHVGSTSVPGLAAKPILDVLLVVEDTDDEASYVPALEAAGFVLRIREPNWFGHRLLKTPAGDVNLHVFPAGCAEADRMLAFRDHLRAHADDRRLYEDTKRALAARTWRDVQDYADAKTEVVREILARALGEQAR